MSVELPDETRGQLASDLAAVVEDLADDLGEPPVFQEFLELIGWSFPPTGPVLGAGLRAPVTVRADLGPRGPYRAAGAVRTDDVGDGVYASAAELVDLVVTSWSDRGGDGRLVDVLDAELRTALVSARVRFNDCDPGEVTRLQFVIGPPVTKPRRGDVLAIPAADGAGYHPAVVTGHDDFGMSVGVFRGRVPLASVLARADAVALRRQLYLDDDLVIDGTVPRVGHEESLLAHFPDPAEIYHEPDGDEPEVGPFGSAETADGDLRHLGEQEAREAGVLDGSYLQFPAFFQIQELLAGLR